MSRTGTYKCFNEAWTRENFPKYTRNKDLWEAYQMQFKSSYSYNSYRTFLLQLGLRREWSPEMTEFLREKYSEWGAEKSQEEILKKFGVLKSKGCIYHNMQTAGISVDKEIKINNIKKGLDQHTFPIGTIRFHRNDSKRIHRAPVSPFIKTENGWKPYGLYLKGHKSDNLVAIPLDGNNLNLDPENWFLIPKKLVGTISKLGLWFNDPELTKTGIAICELISAMKQKEKEVNIG